MDFYRVAGGSDGAQDAVPLRRDCRGGRELRPSADPKIPEMIQAEGHDISHIVERICPVQTIKVMDGEETFYGLGISCGG